MASPQVYDPTTFTLSTDTNDLDWITTYLNVHSLSVPSRRYSFILWIIFAAIFLAFAVLHWTGSRAGVLGAHWTKWTLRRRTWRKKHTLATEQKNGRPHRQPLSLPSNAQLLCFTVLIFLSLALCFIGPDYIAPTQGLWQLRRRDYDMSIPDPSLQVTSTSDSQSSPYTIQKSWWTSSARIGQITFALFPLCVLFALKAPPFAVFAIPFMIQVFFDKLAWLHRWSGRLIWFLSALHVILWSVQLALDKNPDTGKTAYTYAWGYAPFIYGWVAFGLLTIVIILSIHPLRRSHYEAFYFMHVLLVPLTLVMAAVHHPSLWWWCTIALTLWIAERTWRAVWWLYTNGIFFYSRKSLSLPPSPTSNAFPADHWDAKYPYSEQIPARPRFVEKTVYPSDQTLVAGDSHFQRTTQDHAHGLSNSPISPSGGSPTAATPLNPLIYAGDSRQLYPPAWTQSPLSYIPPPGYAHVELLSGQTLRLRFITPGSTSWAPGQHFLVNIPSVSRFTSHPFTSVSLFDEKSPTDAGRMLEMIIRAKNGWTSDLWDMVIDLTSQNLHQPSGEKLPEGTTLPSRGVLMRIFVDGPFGSSIRARWGDYSTVLIVVGGSGVSFGLSILQYVCLCMSGRDGQELGAWPGGWRKKTFSTTRVRFVWLVREYSHIQWGASIIRRCLSMCSPYSLQVDIFVTNFTPIPKTPEQQMHLQSSPSHLVQSPELPQQTVRLVSPRTPSRHRNQNQSHLRTMSEELIESETSSAEEYVDLTYNTGTHGHAEEELGDIGLAHERLMLDLTHFDGETDAAMMPGEQALNMRVKNEGILRRNSSKRTGRPLDAAADLSQRMPRRPPPSSTWARKQRHRRGKASDSSAYSTDELLPPPSPIIDHQFPAPHESGSFTAMFGPVHRDTSWSGSHPRASQTRRQKPSISLPLLSREGAPGFDSSLSGLAGKSVSPLARPSMSRHGLDFSDDGIKLEVDAQEAADVSVVSEHARPGKPKLDRILEDEVYQSQGPVVVACCGPTSLNAMIRKIIASQIEPSRMRYGDARGSIALVSEEFEY